MSKIQFYIESVGAVNLAIFGLLALIFGVVLLLLPKRYNLAASLIALPPWLLIGQLDKFGAVMQAAKATGFLVGLWVAWAAATKDDPRNRMPPGAWAYALYGVISFMVAAFGPPPQLLPTVIQFQWMMIAAGAVLAVRTIHDEQSAHEVFGPLTMGFGLCTIILAIPALLGSGVHAGHNRYFPWGSNPNQSGSYLAIPVALCLMYSMTGKKFWRLPSGATSSVALALIIMTKSRSVLALAIITTLAGAMRLRKKPAYLAVLLVLGAIIAGYVVRGLDISSFDRLYSTDSSNRFEIAQLYLEKFQESPIYGEMFAAQHETVAVVKGKDAHNLYLETLHAGGIIFFVPLCLIVLLSLWGGLKLSISPHKWGMDALVARTMYSILLGCYVYSLASNNSFYGTSALAFVTVLSGSFCMKGLASPAYEVNPARMPMARMPYQGRAV